MKRLAIGVLSVFFACSLLAGSCGQVDVRAHGTIHFFVDSDCWQFAADDGTLYQIVYAPQNILRDGLTGLMEATWSPLKMPSRCGNLINVCSFSADGTLHLVGTLRYFDIAGGCYRLETGNKVYAPLSQDPLFFQDGAQVKVEGLYLPNVDSACQAPVLQVIDYDFIGACAGQCRHAYRECVKLCSENPCLVSCEDVYGFCLGSCE